MRGVKPRSPVFGAEGLGIEGGWSSVGCPLACAFGSGHCVRECWTEFAATASRPGAAGASKRVIGRIIGQILATRVSPLGATQPVRRPRAGAHGRCWSPPQQRRRCSSSVPTWARTAANICSCCVGRPPPVPFPHRLPRPRTRSAAPATAKRPRMPSSVHPVIIPGPTRPTLANRQHGLDHGPAGNQRSRQCEACLAPWAAPPRRADATPWSTATDTWFELPSPQTPRSSRRPFTAVDLDRRTQGAHELPTYADLSGLARHGQRWLDTPAGARSPAARPAPSAAHQSSSA
jgi:hypothetical protein